MTITTPIAAYTLPLQRDVALFHEAFGMPNAIAAPVAASCPSTRSALARNPSIRLPSGNIHSR